MKLQKTDLLQVTAQSCGVILLTLTMSGVSSLNDVLREVRKEAPADRSILTVKLRNRTQGWTQQHNLVMKKRTPPTGAGDVYPSLFA